MKSIQVVTCPVCKAKLKVIVEAQMRENPEGVAIDKDDQQAVEVDAESYVPMLPNIGYMTSLFYLDTTSRGRLWSNGAIVLMFNPPWVFDVVPQTLDAMGTDADTFLADMLAGLKTADRLRHYKASKSFVYMRIDGDEDQEVMCNRSFVDVFYFAYGDSLRFFFGKERVGESSGLSRVIYVVSRTTLVGFFMPIVRGSHGKAPIQES